MANTAHWTSASRSYERAYGADLDRYIARKSGGECLCGTDVPPRTFFHLRQSRTKSPTMEILTFVCVW